MKWSKISQELEVAFCLVLPNTVDVSDIRKKVAHIEPGKGDGKVRIFSFSENKKKGKSNIAVFKIADLNSLSKSSIGEINLRFPLQDDLYIDFIRKSENQVFPKKKKGKKGDSQVQFICLRVDKQRNFEPVFIRVQNKKSIGFMLISVKWTDKVEVKCDKQLVNVPIPSILRKLNPKKGA